MTKRGNEAVMTKVEVEETITVGAGPVGVIYDVTVTGVGIFETANGLILKAEKSIHDVLAKKFGNRKVVASTLVI